MNGRVIRWFLPAGVLLLAAIPIMVVEACGPDFLPEVFIPAHRPVAPPAYARGRLGVLQAGYYIAEKVVAFRYLNEGSLDAEEQAQLAEVNPVEQDWEHMSPKEVQAAQAREEAKASNIGPARWLAARAGYGSGTPSGIGQEKRMSYKDGAALVEVEVLNCPDAAFDTAVATLRDRARRWGATSAALRDWIAGQDAVFSNCAEAGRVPALVGAGAEMLLRQDRAYQAAAARFYAGEYAASADAFAAIARDTDSPWARWGEYLQARSLIRGAFVSAPGKDMWEPATFNRELLRQADAVLIAAAGTSRDAGVRHAIAAEKDLVNARLEPGEQAERLANELAGPDHDADFGQHLVDLRFLLDQGVTGHAPLLEWMQRTGTVFGVGTSREVAIDKYAAASTLAKWRVTPGLAWLIAALQSGDHPDADLLGAAAAVPESSPGYVTAQYHRARLEIAAGDPAGARELTTHVLQLRGQNLDVAATNALLSLRMQTAPGLEEMLRDAPRELISAESSASGLALCAPPVSSKGPCRAALPQQQFDADAAAVFNSRLPLSLWVEAARSPALPVHLRSAVAWAAWVRALELGRDDVAGSLVPLLPGDLRTVLQRSSDPGGFSATLLLLHSPGLRPFLEQGVQRSVSYSMLDDYRDNWWCKPATEPPPVKEPFFLSERQKEEARHDASTLARTADGIVWLGRRTLDFARAHPAAPRAPEALALVVRATHFGCWEGTKGDARRAVSKEAFTMLHTRYPKSEWAAKTPYYY